MRGILHRYKQAFSGLSGQIWLIALVCLINRTGTMVVPFMSVYLTGTAGFSLLQAGQIMMVFGLGSVAGSYISGRLIDRIGSFWVMAASLIFGGIGLALLPLFTDFYPLAAAVFVVSLITEAFRPAAMDSTASYARPENRTRALSLLRMALNLGYAFGPAIGGLLAAKNFTLLFWADGATCVLAGFLFFALFYTKIKKARAAKKAEITVFFSKKSPYREPVFVVFLLLATVFAVCFFQFFTVLPLFWREIGVTETIIGLLISSNGFIVFFVEMPIVAGLGESRNKMHLVAFGAFCVALGYVFLNTWAVIAAWAVTMLLISLGEVFAFPFMNSFVLDRADETNRGQMLGAYSLVFSTALIIAPILGTGIAENFGFRALWFVVFGAMILAAAGFWFLGNLQKKPEQEVIPEVTSAL